MGCPEGMSKIHYTRLALEIIMVCHCIFLGDKGGHYYIQTNRSKRPFFPLLSSSRKTLGRRALILSEYVGMCSCPLGIP